MTERERKSKRKHLMTEREKEWIDEEALNDDDLLCGYLSVGVYTITDWYAERK